LLCDASENVRGAMAAHLLKKLGDCRREKSLASYEELYLEFASQLTAMAEDPSHKVRLTLAAAAETPPNAFWSLYEDRDHVGVVNAVQASLLPLGYYIDEGVKITHRKRPSRDLVKSLAQSENPFLRHIAASLKPGAPFLLTTLNGYRTIRRAGTETTLDPLTMIETWPGDDSGELQGRHYIGPELVKMHEAAGLHVEHTWGGTAGRWARRTLDWDEIEVMFLSRKA
jgi:hypothetical protein